MLAAIIATVSALGVMVLATGISRLRRRSATSRRVAALLVDAPGAALDARPGARAVWQLELHQVLAQIESHDSKLRTPTIMVALASGLIGVSTVSPLWLGLALLAGVGFYALGARQRARKKIEAQALDAMSLLASGLRAGYSVPQAIALVAKHSPDPTSSEFALAAQEISVGVHLAEAIARMAKRTANADYAMVAIIVRVQHEVGGNLALILDSVGNTLRERFELRRQVTALTAQQRLSSLMLTMLPFGLLAFLFVVDRSFVDPLFTEPAGRGMLAAAGAMIFTGWTVMRSLAKVEV